MFVPVGHAYQQKARDDHWQIREQAELYKLRKIFAVKSKGATIQRSHAFALCSQRTRKCKRSLRALARVLRKRGHHNSGRSLGDLMVALAKLLRLLLAMRAHHCGSVAGKRRLASQHLVSNDAETVNV